MVIETKHEVLLQKGNIRDEPMGEVQKKIIYLVLFSYQIILLHCSLQSYSLV